MRNKYCTTYLQNKDINSVNGLMIGKLLHSLNKKLINRTELFEVFGRFSSCGDIMVCKHNTPNIQGESRISRKHPANMTITGWRSAFSKWRFSQSLFSRCLNGCLEMMKT
ncbi:MAG: hypothetical protein OEY49_17130 [Candidatus Heimdallarchaeota archaeon]|nr:hypothetical protein [Candidatus Heimdallarchaeota archaeon]